MSGGYSRADIIRNLRNRKMTDLNELHSIAYAKKNQVHEYARKEAKREIRRRLTGKTIKRKPTGLTNRFNIRMPRF